MPLTGELEHLPIVDVIQLIHSTRKSGTLNVYSHNGEGQLVFNNGYIIGATHSSEKIKVGQILLANQAISQQCLDKALEIQEISGENRKPVIAILLDNCGVSKEAAFKALETLIEMTVVEMISWVKGVFTLDVNEVNVSDDYRYLPEQLQAISLDTQMVLLDALRIYDEKVHSGEIQISDEPLQENPLEQFEKIAAPEPETTTDGIEVSEDLLGLADLDKVERKKPYVFKVLEVFDPADIHRQVIDKAIPHIKEMEKEKLVNFLSGISSLPRAEDNSPLMAAAKSQAVIIFTGDDFLQHAIMTVCKKEGIMVFATADRDNLDNLINQTRLKQIEPILIFGQPLANNEVFSQAQLVDIRAQKITQYPQIAIIQLAYPVEYNFSLQALNDGCRVVFPLPDFSAGKENFATLMIEFFNTFQTYICNCFNDEQRLQFIKLRNSLAALRLLNKASDISVLVLQFASELFERTLTLIVDKSDLIAERSAGIIANKDNGIAAPMKFRIPILSNSILREVIDSKKLFFGTREDSNITELLYPEIGSPTDGTFLLLPLISNDKVITITYADFGDFKATKISTDYLEFFTNQAGVVMENALLRKLHNNSKQPKEIS